MNVDLWWEQGTTEAAVSEQCLVKLCLRSRLKVDDLVVTNDH